MKTLIFLCLVFFVSSAIRAATPAEEKAFVDKYKAAFESKDTATLESFLYTQGADPMVVSFYKMMQSSSAGGKVAKIELADLTPEDVKKAAEPQDSPAGGKLCLNLKPVKKLVIRVDSKDENGSSSNTTTNFVAEKDGKFVIPVPGACK